MVKVYSLKKIKKEENNEEEQNKKLNEIEDVKSK